MPNDKNRITKTISIALAALIAAAAGGVFVLYALKHRPAYGVNDLILPALCLALFAAVLAAALPRLIRLLSGNDEFADEPAGMPWKKLLFIALGALVLHFAMMLLGVFIYGKLNPNHVPQYVWRNAWMKSNTDARHYIHIAENWYAREGDDKLLIVFFPMLPVLIRGFNLLTHDSFVSALIINAVSTVLASCMAFLTLRGVLGEKRSTAAAFIALLLPGAIFMNSPMSEPLFMLFAFSAFYFMQRKRFIPAGVFTALAGFTRSLGVLCAVPLALIGVSHIVGLIRSKKKWGGPALCLVIGGVISCLGTLAYLYINYSIHGDPLKFFEFQLSNWHQQASPFFDTPRYVLSYGLKALESGDTGFFSLWLPQLIAIFGSLLIMLFSARKLPASYTVYFLCYYAVAIGCTWLLSAVRYLSAAVPLIAAFGLFCDKKRKTIPLFVLLIAVYAVYMVLYMKRYGVY